MGVAAALLIDASVYGERCWRWMMRQGKSLGGGRVGVEAWRDGRDEGDSIDFVGDEVCGR